MSQIKSYHNFDFQKIGKHVLEIEISCLSQLYQSINQDFDHICETIFHCVGKVIVMGMGKSGHIGRKIAATFASTGTPSFFIHPGEAAHGDLGMVTSQDVVIAISNSGETTEIISLIPALKRMQVKLICITSKSDSSIAHAADIHLCTKVLREACPLGLAPTSSTTAVLVIGDALAIALLAARGFSTEDFMLSHPGGLLGRKLLLVDDVMHIGSNIPYVNRSTSLNDALLEFFHKNLDIIVICDPSMNIEGVFTKNELKKLLNKNINMNCLNISDVMTKDTILVNPGTLAIKALDLMQSNRTNSIVVAKKNRLIGIVHIHDLIKLLH